MKGKHFKESKSKFSFKKVIKICFVILLIITIFLIAKYFILENKDKKESENILDNININEDDITEQKTKRMLQLEELKKQNEDIIGWIEINGTNINYPVMQTTDNEFYMTHNYKKEYSAIGSLFLDKDYNWELPSTNLLIYGHNNKNETMLQNLTNYKNESYYKEHPDIKFTTINEDAEYEIIAAFYSRVYYKNEKNVFRYYYFINANNKEEFDNYVNESKKASIYNTGKTAEYGAKPFANVIELIVKTQINEVIDPQGAVDWSNGVALTKNRLVKGTQDFTKSVKCAFGCLLYGADLKKAAELFRLDNDIVKSIKWCYDNLETYENFGDNLVDTVKMVTNDNFELLDELANIINGEGCGEEELRNIKNLAQKVLPKSKDLSSAVADAGYKGLQFGKVLRELAEWYYDKTMRGNQPSKQQIAEYMNTVTLLK